MKRPESVDRLISLLGRLPGVGRRSGERMAMAALRDREGLAGHLAQALQEAAATVTFCRLCGTLTLKTEDPCALCTDPRRDNHVLCVVEDPSDIPLIERSGAFRGRYHALMGKLSPMRGEGPDQLRIQALLDRINGKEVREVLLALNTDVESDATAGYLTEQLLPLGVSVYRLARGLPAGSGIAYSDSQTLSQAIRHRVSLK